MMLESKKLRYLLLSLLIFPVSVYGQLRLPKVINDGMVLQRNAHAKVWGWANPNEAVSVSFHDSTYQTVSDDKGNWSISLAKYKAGGPYNMTISSGKTIVVKDILIGDVWLSSGQSNMVLPMSRVSPLYESEIAHSKNNKIRYFNVPDGYNFKAPQKDFNSGKWQKANPENVPGFSAAAYFFADQLYQKYGVPIGIINSSLGGSPAEAWISEGTLKEEFPKYYKEAQRFKSDALIQKIRTTDQNRRNTWYRQLREKDRGFIDPQHTWVDPNLNTDAWSTMQIPGYWADTKLGSLDGVVWFRKEITVPEEMVGKPAKLLMGRIVDADSTYINGKFVGTVSYQYPPRRYEVPAGILKEGKNTITVRVINERGKGGFVLDKPYELSAAGDTIDLKGSWKYRLGARMKSLPSQTFIRWKPVGLYNAMIAPLLNERIKGVIWYQGESNADRPVEYHRLFATMIKDWRNKWQQGELPFLYVQLANYMKSKNQPSRSNWALLRESQLKTLSLPNTAMAVTIDIGEWNDIHPLDKKDVGKRLALAAEKVAYGEDNIVYSGPIYQSMKIEGNKIVLSFNHTGNGLVAKGDDGLKEFAIAGKDHKFFWANAKIKNNKVVVWSEKVPNPVAVRYAWADNPDEANLYNQEGLPASPFRTDDWPAKVK